MRIPRGYSEGPMPRHLLNRTHFDVRRAGAPDPNDISDTSDVGHALCGQSGLVMATRIDRDVTCAKCRARRAKGVR